MAFVRLTQSLSLRRTLLYSFVSVSLVACAPESQSPQHSEVEPEAPITTFAFKGREAGLAQTSAYLNNEIRRSIEESLLMIPNTRKEAKPGQTLQLGCRTYRKLGPDPEARTPSYTEMFVINQKCFDGATLFVRADARGAEEYHLAYAEPLPRIEEDRPFGFPVSISVDTRDTQFDARFSPGAVDARAPAPFTSSDSVLVSRLMQTRIELTEQNELTLTYRASLNLEDEFNYSVHSTKRAGELTVEMRDSLFVVDRKTRKVISGRPGVFEIEMEGTEWVENQSGRRFHERSFGFTDHTVTFESDLTYGYSLCDYADAAMKVSDSKMRDANQTKIKMIAGSVVVGESKLPEMKACRFDQQTWSNHPNFAQPLETLYF